MRGINYGPPWRFNWQMSTKGQQADKRGQSGLIDWTEPLVVPRVGGKKQKQTKQRESLGEEKGTLSVCRYLQSCRAERWGWGGGWGGRGRRGGRRWRGSDFSCTGLCQLLQLQIHMLAVCAWERRKSIRTWKNHNWPGHAKTAYNRAFHTLLINLPSLNINVKLIGCFYDFFHWLFLRDEFRQTTSIILRNKAFSSC